MSGYRFYSSEPPTQRSYGLGVSQRSTSGSASTVSGHGLTSPHTRSKTDATSTALWTLLDGGQCSEWYYPIFHTGCGTFSRFIEKYGLQYQDYHWPHQRSRDAANELYEVDVRKGGDHQRMLPRSEGEFYQRWAYVEHVLVSGYRLELERLKSADLPGSASVTHDASKKPKKSAKRKLSERLSALLAGDSSPSADLISGDGFSDDSQPGCSTRHKSKSARKLADDEADCKRLMDNYTELANGYEFDALSRPGAHVISSCFKSITSSTPQFTQGGTQQCAYLLVSEGEPTKDKLGGFDERFDKLETIIRFNLVLDTWTLAMCVNQQTNPLFKHFKPQDCDFTILLNKKPNEPAQPVGVIPQVINSLKIRMSLELAEPRVTREQAAFVCRRFLERIIATMRDLKCSLTRAVLKVQDILGIFESDVGAASSSTSARRETPRGICKHFKKGTCRVNNCKFSHGLQAESPAASAASRASRNSSAKSGDSFKRKDQAGRTPGAQKKKASFAKP